MNNLEGFIDENYIRLYDPEHWDWINEEYNTKDYIPKYKIIGSIDFDALCIGEDDTIYILPFIPMLEELRDKYKDSLESLKRDCEISMEVMNESYGNYGLEVHFINPLAFGGSPTDPKNIAFLSRHEHIQACNFWNTIYFRMKNDGNIT